MGTMRLSGPTAPQPHREAPVPLSACAFHVPSATAKPALTLLPKPFGGLDCIFFSIAYENSGGGETLKTQAGTVTLRLQNA